MKPKSGFLCAELPFKMKNGGYEEVSAGVHALTLKVAG